MHAHVLGSVHGSLLQIVGSSAFVCSILFLPCKSTVTPPPPLQRPCHQAKRKIWKINKKAKTLSWAWHASKLRCKTSQKWNATFENIVWLIWRRWVSHHKTHHWFETLFAYGNSSVCVIEIKLKREQTNKKNTKNYVEKFGWTEMMVVAFN